MTVGELIIKLSKLNKDLHVYVPRQKDEDFPEYQLVENADDVELASPNDSDLECPCVVIE
jgi:hypothetical protein